MYGFRTLFMLRAEVKLYQIPQGRGAGLLLLQYMWEPRVLFWV